jgi:hypothetical protein
MAAGSRLDGRRRAVLPHQVCKHQATLAAAPVRLDGGGRGAGAQEGAAAAHHAKHALDVQRRPAA